MGLESKQVPQQKGTSKVNGNSTRRVRVEPGGTGVAAHVGLHAIGCFADRMGLGTALSDAIPVRGERRPVHDRGTVLVHAALMLAGGGESCLDIEHLRAQGDLFGAVASDSTLWRAFHELDPATLQALHEAVRPVRAEFWRRAGVTKGRGPVILDLDASLVDIHSDEKEGTAPTYKGNFGFHPIFCFADATGECLAELLRPGNATANEVKDNLAVLDAGLSQLPEDTVTRRGVMVRSDSAGCTKGFLAGCRERGVSFMWWRGRTPRSKGPSSTPWAWRSAGRRHSSRTGIPATALR